MAKFTKDEFHGLRKLGDAIKAKDRLGEGKCAPTGLRYVSQVESLKRYEEAAKTDNQIRNMLIASRKSLNEQLAKEYDDVIKFDRYWTEHKKEILAECDKAVKMLNSIKI